MISLKQKSFNIFDMNGTFTLRNTVKVPYLGLNISNIKSGDSIFDATKRALTVGYRYFDTSSKFNNEKGFGRAVKESNIDREKLFISSKIADEDLGFEKILERFNTTIQNLGVQYIDLLLIEHPVEGLMEESWRALEQMYVERRVRAIGVCNFSKEQMQRLIAHADVFPVVNQIEFNPLHHDNEVVDFCNDNDIQIMSIGSLKHGEVLELDEIKSIAQKHNVFPCQIVLRWALQHGVITLPQAEIRDHLISNSAIFNFELSENEMEEIDVLGQLQFV